MFSLSISLRQRFLSLNSLTRENCGGKFFVELSDFILGQVETSGASVECSGFGDQENFAQLQVRIAGRVNFW